MEWKTIHAPDGWCLQTRVATGAAPRAVAILGHAMMVDGRTLHDARRPGLGGAFLSQNIAVLIPDLRGHGRSGPTVAEGGSWSYDDLVSDTASYCELARRLFPGKPIFLVGHSLFGHTSLAWLSRGAEVDGLVMVAANIWLRSVEPDMWRRAAKTLAAFGTSVVTRTLGYLPVRRLGIGPWDEPLPYWRPFWRWISENRWTADDGYDYGEALPRVRTPVLVVVSDGDRLLCNPGGGLGFTASLPHRDVLHVGQTSGLYGRPPGHMGLVTDEESAPIWDEICRWVVSRVDDR